jgi:hypothetical protein
MGSRGGLFGEVPDREDHVLKKGAQYKAGITKSKLALSAAAGGQLASTRGEKEIGGQKRGRGTLLRTPRTVPIRKYPFRRNVFLAKYYCAGMQQC